MSALSRHSKELGTSRGGLLRSYDKQHGNLTEMEGRMLGGIRSGERNQTIANRVGDFFGVFGMGLPANLLGDMVVDAKKPSYAHPDDYAEGRKEANDREMGAFGTAAVGYGMAKLGKTAPPISMLNALQSSIRRAMDDPDNVGTAPTTIDSQKNSPSHTGNGSSKAGTAIAAMSKSPGMTGTRPPGNAFGWSPVNIGRYSRNPMNMARNS